VGKLLLVVIIFAALVYTAFWLLDRRRNPGPGARRRPAPRVFAPDDDEEFLRDLNRRNRHPDHGPEQDGPGD
jgi:hypothetical protein